MYAWLVDETSAVRWRKFFVFKRDYEQKAIEEAQARFARLPADYILFIQTFGESLLFRSLQDNWHNMSVSSHPAIFEWVHGESLLNIGYFINGGNAFYRKRAGTAEVQPAVFESCGVQVRKAADSFEHWLRKRYNQCRKLYKKAEWKRIVEGAAPFTPEEKSIVEAIGLFSFEKVGVAENGDLKIRVSNNSNRRLPYLSIGARVPGRLNGGIRVDVSDLAPGEAKIVEQDCYKFRVPADMVELFRKPLPEPEEREMYYEFGVPEWMKKK